VINEYKIAFDKKFDHFDVKNGLPEFYLRSDEDIFSEVIQDRQFGWNWEFNVANYYPDDVFKKYNATYNDDRLVPRLYSDRCRIVFERIERLCDIKNSSEKLIFWGLKQEEAMALSNIEYETKGVGWNYGQMVTGYLTEEYLAKMSREEISDVCNVNSTRATEIWEIFTPIRGKFNFGYQDKSKAKKDWYENSWLPWKNEMKRKSYLRNLPSDFESHSEKAAVWANDLGLRKISSPQFSLFLFEEGIDIIGRDRKQVLDMVNEAISSV
jgi:hypothetical protein